MGPIIGKIKTAAARHLVKEHSYKEILVKRLRIGLEDNHSF